MGNMEVRMANYNYDVPLGFVSGLLSGYNNSLNKAMERRYEQNVRNQAMIQKTLSSIDIPQMLVEKHQEEASTDIAGLRGKLIEMIQSKKGFHRGEFGNEELMYVNSEASRITRKYKEYAAQDNMVKLENKKFNPKIYDQKEWELALDTYEKTGVWKGGLVENPTPVLEMFKGADEQAKAMNIVPEKVRFKDKDGKYKDRIDYDQFPETQQIRDIAYNKYMGTVGGQRTMVQNMVTNYKLNNNIEEMVGIAQITKADPNKFMDELNLAAESGNTRALEFDKRFIAAAYKWGERNVMPNILKTQTPISHDQSEPKIPKGEKPPALPYESYDNKPMPDGTTTTKAYVFKKPIETNMPASDMLGIDNKPLDTNKEVNVKINEMGGHWAYGEATYPFGSDKVTKQVKIKLEPASKFIRSAIPELKDKIVIEKPIVNIIYVNPDGKKYSIPSDKVGEVLKKHPELKKL
jgi:hypothetical protein